MHENNPPTNHDDTRDIQKTENGLYFFYLARSIHRFQVNSSFFASFYPGCLRTYFLHIVIAVPGARTGEGFAIAAGSDTGILNRLRTVGIGHGFGIWYRTGVWDTGDRHPRRLGHSTVGYSEDFVPVDKSGVENSGRREGDRILRSIGLSPGRRSGDINTARTGARPGLIETGPESGARRSGGDRKAAGSVDGARTTVLADREVTESIGRSDG